jgi:xanthine dehydrogenase accessory factor
MQRLLEEGEDPARLSKIHAPIGIAIAAQSPAEIAVSIAAELIDVFNAGNTH